MSYSKSIAIVLTTAVCAFAVATDAGAQTRGRSSGGRPSVGSAAPRSSGPAVRTAPYRSNVIVRGGVAPLRSYYYPYYYGYRPGFSIGLGLGYRDVEFDAFAVPRGRRVAYLEEALNLLPRLWTERDVHHRSERVILDGVTFPTIPARRPHPPIWAAANNDPAVRRAARMAACPVRADSGNLCRS